MPCLVGVPVSLEKSGSPKGLPKGAGQHHGHLRKPVGMGGVGCGEVRGDSSQK